MELRKVILTKSQLAALPQAERSLLLLLGHASNEINVLSKLILMVRKDAAPSPIAEKVEAGQACVLLRVLVGQLHEAWEQFRKRVLTDRQLQDKFVPLLDSEGTAALNNLKRHFAGSPLTQIRKKIAFHDDLTEQSFQAAADTEPLELYLTTQVGNSFYYASELIVMSTAIRMVMSGDDAAAFEQLCRIATMSQRCQRPTLHPSLGKRELMYLCRRATRGTCRRFPKSKAAILSSAGGQSIDIWFADAICTCEGTQAHRAVS